jgi:hypothetical protein
MDSRFLGNTYCTDQDFKRALISFRKVISFWRVATLIPWGFASSIHVSIIFPIYKYLISYHLPTVLTSKFLN